MVLLASVACLILTPAALSDELALPGVSATPGTRLVLPVEFRSLGGSVAGVQFDLQYDSAAMSIAETADDAVSNSGKSLYHADLAPNKRRFLVVGLNQNSIPSGTLIHLLVYLNPNASNGLYPLIFSNIVATDRYGLAEPTTGVDGAVMVQAATGQGARLQPTGVVNGASLLPGPVAPGEIVRLVGSFVSPASPVLAETGVLFDGTPASLFSAAPEAIEAIVPYAVSGKTLTRMQVTNGDRVIAELLLPAAAAVPGIFTLNSSGIGPGAVLNQDSSMNSPSNPAAQVSVVAVF
ncbi:MAG: cohesin domain-containing protein, partial [Acidobacteria bacterium]|nr:cohesin domain-containing protein [Acidobacteriota bacterium]